MMMMTMIMMMMMMIMSNCPLRKRGVDAVVSALDFINVYNCS